MTRNIKSMVGLKFGKLTVVERVPAPNDGPTAWWQCLCDCGVSKQVEGRRLRNGNTRSCGCLCSTKKGITSRKLFATWRDMNRRCSDSRSVDYKYYGGRGINVCDRWKTSFENFQNDMGERPDGHTLDRIDNDGNYEPSNCRWATRITQLTNRRKTK